LAKADKAREELGWLKVVFAVSAAVDTSVLGWLAQKHNSADALSVVVAILVAAGLTADVAWMNIVAYRRIRELEYL
jgi:GMP synthase PP-ATPase subunit